MPRVDNENRLRIPKELWKRALNFGREIAFAYEEGKIQISLQNKSKSSKVIAFRTMDSKGRVTIPKEVAEILHYENREEILVVYMQEECLFIEKL